VQLASHHHATRVRRALTRAPRAPNLHPSLGTRRANAPGGGTDMPNENDTKTDDAPDYKAREYTKVEGSEKEAAKEEPAKAETTYTVKKDDTLSDIAQDKLGDANRWNEIYEMNKDAIGDNPDVIHPGTKLKLPS